MGVLELGLPNLDMVFKVFWDQTFQIDQKKTGPVLTITFEGLKLRSPNLGIRCIMDRSRMGLYIVEFDPDLQGHLLSKQSKSAEKVLVRTIIFEETKCTCNDF